MRVRVLGSAAGGGLPQWNCGCDNCVDARSGDPAVRPRTQSSITVSADGDRWALFNASPDVRAQLESFAALHPARGGRGSGVAAVVLTDAEVDHTAGLLLLREGRRLALHCTRFVHRALTANGLLATLGSYLEVRWTELSSGVMMELADGSGWPLGIQVEPFEVAGDPPLYLEGLPAGEGVSGGPGSHTVGLRVSSVEPGANAPEPNVTAPGAAALVYVPGAGAVDAGLLARIGPRDALLWDGTFWTDDELVRLGMSDRTAAEMSHLPISGPGGSLERFREVRAASKAYIHVNNTNPILREDSAERRAVEAAGWEVAFDGMDFEI